MSDASTVIEKLSNLTVQPPTDVTLPGIPLLPLIQFNAYKWRRALHRYGFHNTFS